MDSYFTLTFGIFPFFFVTLAPGNNTENGHTMEALGQNGKASGYVELLHPIYIVVQKLEIPLQKSHL